MQLYEAYGFLGLLHVESRVYAALATQVKVVAQFRGHAFYQLLKTEFVQVGEGEVTEQARGVLDSTAKVLESGFYASQTFDLARSMQKQTEGLDEQAEKYYWNQTLCKELLQQGAAAKWLMPIVQGFIGFQRLNIPPEPIDYLLISRRCNGRAGTRYNVRGVDDEGEVANFVETEQIIWTDDTVLSLVMVRGTVPVFWQQTGLTARFELTRSKELTAPAFVKSLTNLINTYEKVLFVNLLSTKKPHERVLTEALKGQIKLHQSQFEDSLHYVAYDYKTETKGNLANASALVTQLSPYLLLHLFFSVQGKEILSRQKGVTRINCLDCLDRTNIVMSRLAWYMLGWELRSVGRGLVAEFDDMENEAVAGFKALWVENGDALSRQYTGAGSSASTAVRTGKDGFMSLIEQSMTGIERFYSAAYDDAKKQDGIDTLLGKHSRTMTEDLQTEALRRHVKERESEFLGTEEVIVRVCTWNVRGERPPPSDVLTNFIFENGIEPHLIAISLQDLVLVNAANVFQSTKHLSLISAWTNLISVTFTRHTGRAYLQLKCEVQVGLLSVVYVRSDLAPFVSNLDVDKVRLGLDTALAGKGAIVVRLNLYHSSICFANVHLFGSNIDNSTRLKQLEAIEAQAFQVESVGKRKRYHINSHDAVFLYGDLNFKIESTGSRIYQCCKSNNLPMLLANEQLITVMLEKKSRVLDRFKEGEIDFLPTVNRGELAKESPDLNKAQSWTDRILYSGKGLKQTSYGPIDIKVSSHLPLTSNFSLTVTKINEEQRCQVEREESAKCFATDRVST